MRRVLIIGCSGAGKSTFARGLAARNGLPVIHLDQQYWQPGWTMPPRATWRAKLAALCEKPAWIMDGNFDSSLDLRLPRADAVVWFDFPRHVCLRRVLKRVVTTYGHVRADMAPGCPEQLPDLEFLRWIWNFNRIERPQIAVSLALHGPHLSPVIFRRDRDVRAFLDTIGDSVVQRRRRPPRAIPDRD